jgi:putative flippase GtrA
VAAAWMTDDRRKTFWQLVRYGVNGSIVTALYSLVFAGLDSFTHARPQLCNLGGYIAAVILGYFLHSYITFRGHGARGWGSVLRFVAASFPSYLLNAFWTWLFIAALALPHWTVYLPIWCVTPVMLFVLNRWWVFQ